MLTAVLSLNGALVFGAADFLGGVAARRLGTVLTTAASAFAGTVLLAVLVPLVGGEWSPADVMWGALAGVVGSVAIGLLYASLAIGPMSILSPLTALVSAIVPMTWGLVGGERLGALGPWALGLALVAVVLVGFVPERGAVRPSVRGIVMGIGSGIAIGAFFVIIDRTSDESGLVPLFVNIAVSTVIMSAAAGTLALVARRRAHRAARAQVAVTSTRMPPPRAVPHVAAAAPSSPAAPGPAATSARADHALGLAIAFGCGIANVVANVLLLLGIRAGDLSVAAVLGAMYPAGTILLAALVLRERIAPVQWAGLVLALAAAGMLAVA